METVRQAALVYQNNILTADEKSKWKVRAGITGLDGVLARMVD